MSSRTDDSLSESVAEAGGAEPDDVFAVDEDLLSSLLARILRLRGCNSTVFDWGGTADDEDDEADGLGAFADVSDSAFVWVWLAGLPVPFPLFPLLLLFGWNELVEAPSAPPDGAGDGEELCSCGEELLELRSTVCPVEPPERCELRRTRCWARSSADPAAAVPLPPPGLFPSSDAFVESAGLAHRDDELSLSVESFPLCEKQKV